MDARIKSSLNITGLQVELRPLRDLEANEELLISYIDPISTSIERKTELKEKYNFACR